MKEKDPYLDELDQMDKLDEELPEGESEEPTRVDLEVPHSPQSPEEAAEKPPRAGPAARELMGLSPDIPVQVVVVMGRKGVTVKDLLEIRMGQVIDFEKTPADPVDLVAGGKVIGKGELVEVDGKLGVRVLKLLK